MVKSVKTLKELQTNIKNKYHN